MASISELLQAQGELAANTRLRQGERRGALYSSLGRIPATIVADREAERAAQAQAARQQQADQRAAAADQRAEAQLGLDRERLGLETRKADDARRQAAVRAAAESALNGGAVTPDVASRIVNDPQLFTDEERARLAPIVGTPEGARGFLMWAAGRQPEKPAALIQRDPTKSLVNPTTGEEVSPATPEAPKAPDVGSFAEYVSKFAAEIGKPVRDLTAKDIESARKRYQQADDRIVIQPPRTESGLTPTMEANIINRLTTQWGTAVKPIAELSRQSKLMDTGMEAARRGDMAQGSQAVLVTFQKILDPTSVVRESEYERSAAGQSLMNRVKGAAERLAKGGTGVTLSELEKFAALAREAVKAQSTGYIDAQKSRIGKTADHYKIPRELVFEDFDFGGAGAATAPQADPLGLR